MTWASGVQHSDSVTLRIPQRSSPEVHSYTLHLLHPEGGHPSLCSAESQVSFPAVNPQDLFSSFTFSRFQVHLPPSQLFFFHSSILYVWHTSQVHIDLCSYSGTWVRGLVSSASLGAECLAQCLAWGMYQCLLHWHDSRTDLASTTRKSRGPCCGCELEFRTNLRNHLRRNDCANVNKSATWVSWAPSIKPFPLIGKLTKAPPPRCGLGIWECGVESRRN